MGGCAGSGDPELCMGWLRNVPRGSQNQGLKEGSGYYNGFYVVYIGASRVFRGLYRDNGKELQATRMR